MDTSDTDGRAAADLTARARIRDAALAEFADRGFKGATFQTIADAAGVSTGLIRHHFGSKEGLRRVCDEHAIGTLLDQARSSLGAEAAEPGFMASVYAMGAASARYLARALVEGSPAATEMFDAGSDLAEQFLSATWPDRFPAGGAAVRDAAAVMGAMHLGTLVLHAHLSRRMGADSLDPANLPRTGAAIADIYALMGDYFTGAQGALITEAVASAAHGKDEEDRDE
ncbi:TetR family transcriptional regulator [Murinocardiopsis flavida]|uniref:TetR family transcriptional regulator n=1 Tax=Murinocardiopsis flavida TaxID=645275 RepID=A0A2P8DMI3_9ACTN|nr:TetR/AcrR family transcriptional regulator [Murinocardiopsis flavida]PSK98430.1 TetR family transcriptional regulator [Murinocardiopsis flavida]